MLRVTLKSILGHKARLAMTGLAVVLGVALMAGTLVLTDTVGRTFDDLVADIYDGTDAVVRSSESLETQFGETLRDPLPEEVVAEVAAIDGVAAAEGFVQSNTIRIQDAEGEVLGNPDLGAPTLGTSWGEVEALNPFQLTEGAPPVGPDQIVLDRGSVEEGDFAVGDTVTILGAEGPRDFTLSGTASFGTVDSPGGANIALFDLATAQDVMGLGPVVNEVSVVAEEGLTEQDIVDRLTPAIPQGTEAITGAARTAEDQQTFRDSLAFFNTFLLIFAGVSLLVGAFIIANTFSIIVAQRSRELALLRAIGASRQQVLSSVMTEAAVVGLVASLVGAAFGIAVASLLKALLAAFGIDIPATGVVIQPGSLLVAVLTGLTITTVAALWPAWRSSRIPPLAAMRAAAHDTSATSVIRILFGVILALVSALFLVSALTAEEAAGGPIFLGAVLALLALWVLGPVIGRPLANAISVGLPRLLGVTGVLARENAARNPKRTSATAAALMIGVALVGLISIFASSAKASINALVDESVTGDLIISAGTFGTVGFSPQLAEEVARVEGVDQVTGFRFAQAEAFDSGIFLAGVEADVIVDLADPGVIEGEVAGMGSGAIAVSDRIAEGNDLAVGDQLTLRTQTGQHDLVVAAVYENYEVMGDYLVDLSTFDTLVLVPLDAQVFVTFLPDADLAATTASVEEAVADYGSAEVQDLNEYKKSVTEPFDQIVNLIYALLSLAVIIALIGIANTLALSVHERTQELGLLRAVGMTRRQLRSTIRWESVIIALLGTALGIFVALFYGWILVQALSSEGFTVYEVPVITLVVVVVLAAIAGVAAALFPARRAARLEIMDAISSE